MESSPVELKGMPHHDEAERVCLRSMLLESNNIAQVLSMIRSEDFYRRSHQLIFASIVWLFAAGAEIDPVLLSDELLKRYELQNAGGLEYLDALTEGILRTTNLEYYAGIVKEKVMLRRLAIPGLPTRGPLGKHQQVTPHRGALRPPLEHPRTLHRRDCRPSEPSPQPERRGRGGDGPAPVPTHARGAGRGHHAHPSLHRGL